MSSAAASSSAVVVTNHNNSNNDNNPLLKIWCIQRVLLFVQQNGIVDIDSTATSTQQTIVKESIPRLFQLKDVTSSWNETVEFYIHAIPSDVIHDFCEFLIAFVEEKHSKSEQHATLVRDALLWISKFIIDAESVQKWCECVRHIIFDNQQANQRIFGTEQVRDAFVLISGFAISDDSSYWWSDDIAWLTQDSSITNNRILFGTATVRDAMLTVSKYYSSSQSAHSFCASIANLTLNDNNRILFGTAAVRDGIVAVSKYCATPDFAYSFCLSVAHLAAKNEANKVLLGTVTIRDALLTVSEYCAYPDSAAGFCCATQNIIYQNESSGVLLFATEETRDAVLSVSANINNCKGIYMCCHVIYLLHKTNPTLFCVEETVKSLIKLSKLEMKKQSPESIYWFLNVVLTLLHSNQKMFDTTEIRNAVERFQDAVNDHEQVAKLIAVAAGKTSDEEYVDKARQLCVEFLEVVSEKTEDSSSASSS